MLPYLATSPSTFKRFTSVLITAVALLLFLVAAPSALGARSPHSARAHAGHHASHRRKAGRRAHHRTRAHHRSAAAFKANTTAATTLLGDEAVESNKDSLIAGQAEAFPLQASTSGTAGTAHVYVDYHDAANVLFVGLYTNLNGHPSSLLTTSALFAPVAGAWNTVTLAPVVLASGTTYWLAVLGTGGTLRYRDRAQGPCKAETSAQTNLAALASSWKTGKLYSTCPVSGYVSGATATLPESPPVEVVPVESPPPPPPPAAPTNSSPPSISGTATEGQLLSASTGVWTESPTSYAYQWQDCNSSGASCVSVSGATASSYKLAASDVGHTMRVVVTASNAGGSTPASSAATAIVAAVAPPPPPAPANTAPPSVSGSAVEGQTLSASPGAWSGGPTAYAYQWQDCNGAGEACANVSGATSSSYKLGSGDVGHTIRVAVTASNAGGSTSASSVSVGPARALPPTASFTHTPVSPLPGQQVTFNATSSTCPYGPCTYAWSDDGGTTRPLPPLWPLGSGQTLLFTFSSTGTKYVRLVVTDATGQEATVEGNVIVGEGTPPPSAPVNTVLPMISGSAIEGQTLSASSGSWTESPSSYAYQWQVCDASGGSCSSVSGATGNVYVLGAGDIGHTLRITVRASNGAGVGTAVSEPTAVITGVKSTPTGCFSKLVGGEACGGYPDAGDTGVPVGTGLTKVTGQLIITKEGEVVSNKLIEGGVVIRANNVHLEDDEVVAYTQSKCGEKSGGAAITVLGEPGTEKPVTGVVIKHDTIRGVKATCPEALQAGIWVRVGSAATVTAEYNKLYWLGRCFQSAARWENNYCLLNATLYGEHYEDVFEDGTNTTGAGGVIIKHNTLLNFHEQTAVITLFAHSDVGEEIVENNFMAGGGYVMYLNGRPNAGVTVKGPVRVRGNRVARCTGETEVLTGPNEGVHICKGTKPELQEFPGSTIEGYGESGFFPLGGSFGMYYPEYSPLTFSGNYWDNNLQEIPSP